MKTAIFGVWHVHAAEYAAKALEHGEVVGFYEREDALAEAFAQKFNIPRFATEEALLTSEAEGVIVCSASCDHAEDIIKIANAGKNIFTEKVLALTARDCLRVREAVEQNGVSFTISFFQKYLPSRMAIKRIAESGELGKINYLRFRNCHSGSTQDWLPRHFYNREQCGGGAMIDLGAHGMYLSEWILGMPISASSTFTVSCESAAMKDKNGDGVEDNAVTVLRYANGAIAMNETGFVSGYSPVVFEVHGEDGYAVMTGDSVIKCSAATDGKPVTVTLEAAQPLPIEQFLTGKILPGCSIEEAIRLTELMELAYR